MCSEVGYSSCDDMCLQSRLKRSMVWKYGTYGGDKAQSCRQHGFRKEQKVVGDGENGLVVSLLGGHR